MQKRILSLLLSVLLIVASCKTVPLTGRHQLNLIPESKMTQMAVSQYRSFLTSNPVVTNTSNKNVEMVKRVGSRIAQAVTTYLTNHGYGNSVDDYHWQFNLVKSDEANAWCMPGGKVVVYTGLLPITQNETALAVVLGHEIAHAVARHGNERMSQQLIAQGLQVAGSVALSKEPKKRNIFLQAFGVGGSLGLKAFGRRDELEADQLGLIFMAMAGYDPRQAIPFWKRMASMSGSNNVPTLLSSHPSDAKRIRQIKRLLPKAMKYYKPH
ncbi:MAG TPA: M48 family metallopeptidase [Chitinophagaceae bacterium]|nr:M48 family metallopeptidase [Chitinophagaceae bacterium]